LQKSYQQANVEKNELLAKTGVREFFYLWIMWIEKSFVFYKNFFQKVLTVFYPRDILIHVLSERKTKRPSGREYEP